MLQKLLMFILTASSSAILFERQMQIPWTISLPWLTGQALVRLIYSVTEWRLRESSVYLCMTFPAACFVWEIWSTEGGYIVFEGSRSWSVGYAQLCLTSFMLGFRWSTLLGIPAEMLIKLEICAIGEFYTSIYNLSFN